MKIRHSEKIRLRETSAMFPKMDGFVPRGFTEKGDFSLLIVAIKFVLLAWCSEQRKMQCNVFRIRPSSDLSLMPVSQL